MQISTCKFFGILVAGLFMTQTAQAMPVTWTLDLVFTDGGTALGTFTYDADSDTLSAIDVVTSGGDPSFQLGGHYGLEWNLASPTDTRLVFQADSTVYNPCGGDSAGVCILDLYFATALSNAGGTIDVTSASFEASFPTFDPGLRIVTTGTVTAVPIPAAAWLFGSALGGLGWMRRRKTA